MSIGTRSEVKKFIKSGRVFVNGTRADKPEQKVNTEDMVIVDGEQVEYTPYEYYMLNKPQGYVSAVTDREYPTVVSLIRESRRGDLFPVGRLDKDTEGLLLISNDGALAHELLSPKKHVWKTYLVHAAGKVTQEDCHLLEEGMDIGDTKKTLPAKVRILEYVRNETEHIFAEKGMITKLELTIQEGRYHQVKRMMERTGKPVVFLKRLSMGSLLLDQTLLPGEYRRLTEEEVKSLQKDSL